MTEQMTEKTWLDPLHEARDELLDISLALKSITRAMDRLYMRELADELAMIATGIDRTSKKIIDTIYQKVGDDCKNSQAMTASILQCFLVGLDTGKNAK